MSKYFDIVKPTYLENWPSALCRLSVAQVDIPLTLEDAKALGSNIVEWGEAFGPPQTIDSLRSKAGEALERFPNGAFVRLGSRSPKDAWGFHRGSKLLPGDNPLKHVLDTSERMYEDLRLAIMENYAPHLFVRQWLDFQPWQEFRCFQRDRKLVGISQYNYLRDATYPEIAEHESVIRFGVEAFHADYFAKASHLDDVVFDVIVYVRQRPGSEFGADKCVEVKLLEVNPFFEMTDPCLFDWRNPENFDGRFLFHRNQCS